MKKSLSSNKLNRSTSPSKTKYPYKGSQISPQSYQELFEKMKANREKLCASLDQYTLFIQTQTPLRCLTHNSSISLYSEREKKLLCANCVFGQMSRKYSHIIPLEKANDFLSKDVGQMERMIQKEIISISKVQKMFYNFLENQEGYLEKCLAKLSSKYEEARKKLDERQIYAKNLFISKFEQLKAKNETLLLEISFLRRIYEEEEYFHKPLLEQHFLPYKHLMYTSIVSQSKFQIGGCLKPDISIRNIYQDQFKRIESVVKKIDYDFFIKN